MVDSLASRGNEKVIVLPPPAERNGDVGEQDDDIDMANGEIDGDDGGPPPKRPRKTGPVREPVPGPSNMEPDNEPAANQDTEPATRKSRTKNNATNKGQPGDGVPTRRQRAQTPARDNFTPQNSYPSTHTAKPRTRQASTHTWAGLGGTYRVRAPVYFPPQAQRSDMMEPEFPPRMREPDFSPRMMEPNFTQRYRQRDTGSGFHRARVSAPVYFPPPQDFHTDDSVPSRERRDTVTYQIANIVAVFMLLLLAIGICFLLWNVYKGHDMLGLVFSTADGDLCLPALPRGEN